MKCLRLIISVPLCILLASCALGPSLDERIAERKQADGQTTQSLVARAPPGDELPSWIESERARVSAERTAAGQRFADREVVCWKQFTVNACVRKANVERRATLDRLRLEDLALNDLDRKRRTADRLSELEQRQPAKE